MIASKASVGIRTTNWTVDSRNPGSPTYDGVSVLPAGTLIYEISAESGGVQRLKWDGDGIANGTMVTTGTAGPGDTGPATVEQVGGTISVSTTNAANGPYLRINKPDTNISRLGWNWPATYVRYSVEFDLTYETGSTLTTTTLLRTRAGSANCAQVGLVSNGGFRLMDKNATTLAETAGGLFVIGQRYRLRLTVTGGNAALEVYKGDETVPMVTVSASGDFAGGANGHIVGFYSGISQSIALLIDRLRVRSL